MWTSVAAWNVQEGLAIPGRASGIVDGVRELDADVIVLSDAYALDNPAHGARAGVLAESVDVLNREGYTFHSVEYGDVWRHSRRLAVLTRVALDGAGAVRLGSRNGYMVRTGDMQLVGFHDDDKSALVRSQNMAAFIGYARRPKADPSALIGDLNSSARRTITTRLLGCRAMERAAQHLPHARARSIATRLAPMARDGAPHYAVGQLVAAEYRDADSRRQPTFPARFPLVQLDHIVVPQSIATDRFEVVEARGRSDHHAVRALLSRVA